MKIKKKKLTIILTILLLITGCTNSIDDEKNISNKTQGKSIYKLDTLKQAGGTDWGMSNPYLQDPRGPGTAKVKLVFDSLLEADEEGIIPWLANKWDIDGNIYTFTIVDNSYFHDGTLLTTEDIGFSLDYYEKYPPINNFLTSSDGNIVDSYNIVDDTTIKIKVKQSLANTLTNLGSFLILPKHIWGNIDDPYTYMKSEGFIGSGPYKWGKYDSASGSYEFIAFDKYHGNKPIAERLLFVPVSDPILAFENNEIDITSVPADIMERYKNNPEIGMISKDNDFGYKLLINMERLTDFKELEMRTAVYNAINRQGIVDKVFRGLGSIGSSGYVPPTNFFYNPDVFKYEYDEEVAKLKLSNKAITIELLTSNSIIDIKISELIKNDLEAAGIIVKVLALDGKSRDDRILEKNYDFALVGNGGWGRTPDYLRTLYSSESKFTIKTPHGMGAVGHQSETITELAEKQLYELDFNKRTEIFKELQFEISKEIPIIVLATKSDYLMFRKNYYDGWVKTYDYQQFEQNRLSYVEK